MHRKIVTVLLCAITASTVRCGFLADPYLSEAYIEAFFPESATECLVTWPIHAVALPVTATVDQSIRTVEAVAPAGRDAADYVQLDIARNNVMLSRTIAVPKLIATPLIFVGSYLARWFVPLEEDDRPFGEPEAERSDDDGSQKLPDTEAPPEKQPLPSQNPDDPQIKR